MSVRHNPLTPLLSRCTDGCPPVTKAAVAVSMLTLLPTLLPLPWIAAPLMDATALCVPSMYSSLFAPLAAIPQLLLAPLMHTDLLSGLLSCFALFHLCTRIEQQRGSAALAQLIASILLLTQTTLIIVVSIMLLSPSMMIQARESLYLNIEASSPHDQLRVPVLGALPSSGDSSWSSLFSFSIPTQACSYNNYSIVFALMAVETALAKDTRRLYDDAPHPLHTPHSE